MSLNKQNSLYLYKNKPARLVSIGDRMDIEVEGGEIVRVRSKDITLLHPGPLMRLQDLQPQAGEVAAAWEILAGEKTSLADLAELIYGAYTPSSAWAAWQQVQDGLYFEGTPDTIRARTADEVAHRKQEREQAEAHQLEWRLFISRVRQGTILAEDRERLRDVENMAYGRSQRSVILREIGRAESPESAHALLLELGIWDGQVNPYPVRLGVAVQQVDLPVPALRVEDRLDLTGLPAYAIDDAGTDTPDDAISLDGSRLWVHVADVAALVEPESALDLEARARGESLHLPEGTVHLLPREVTLQLGLGMQPVSPALSFGIDIDDLGRVTGFEIVPTRVRVRRISYAEADGLMDLEPFRQIERLAYAVRENRRAAGAVMLDFPEVKIHIEGGSVCIDPLAPLRSRAIVEECMILAGSETARYAGSLGLSMAFSQQEALETGARPETLSEMFAMRRLLKRSQLWTTPGRHDGLGVPAYTQVTSPLRRYQDLVAHQQIRHFIKHGAPLFHEADILERIGTVDAVIGSLRQAEAFSENHWTMVYLMQNPQWQGEGVLVEKRGASALVIIPSLALETRLTLPHDLPLDARLPLKLVGVDLAQRTARFRMMA